MGTTLNPLINGGPEDDDGPEFPSLSSAGMGSTSVHLRESKGGIPKQKSLKSPKSIIKEAEGVLTRTKPKVKTGKKPENLRASSKGGKRGPFGESYKPVSAPAKGIRVSGK